MRPSHIPLFILLVYISGSIESYARIALDVTNTRSNLADRFFVCLTRNSTVDPSQPHKAHCIKYYLTWSWNATEFVNENGEQMHLVKAQRLDEPWQSKMYLLIWNSNGHSEIIDVSHLTPRNGTMEDIKIFGLRVAFRLMCEKNFYGVQCTEGCDEEAAEGEYICDRDDGHRICLGNRAGEFCEEPLCLSGSTYISGNCICPLGWTGARCDQADCSSGGDCQVEGNDDQHSGDEPSMLTFTLSKFLILLSIAVVFSLLIVLLRCRRAKELREPIPTDFIKPSHCLLPIEDDYPSSISDGKLLE